MIKGSKSYLLIHNIPISFHLLYNHQFRRMITRRNGQLCIEPFGFLTVKIKAILTLPNLTWNDTF